MDRDFKGVWIPKEIWLNKDLTAIDKVVLTEIDSLDNENHCTATNKYLAEFCGVSESTITRSIKKLVDLNLIETEMKTSATGKYRVLKVINVGGVVNLTRGCSQFDEMGVVNLTSNYNINNNINNNTVISKEITEQSSEIKSAEIDLGFGKPKKTKPNLYQQCIAIINDFTDDKKIRDMLVQYLDLLLEKYKTDNKPLYANQFKGMIQKLKGLIDNNEGSAEDIISQSIQKSYTGFFPANNNNYIQQKQQGYRLPPQKKAKLEDLARDKNGNFIVY